MKKCLCLGVIIVAIFLILPEGTGLCLMAHNIKEPEMPLEIKKAETLSELMPFLDGKDDWAKQCVVRRLGELGDKDTVPVLSDLFYKEPYAEIMNIEFRPVIKLEIIKALGRIDGDKAKSALVDILKTYWKRGPQNKNKKNYYNDGDFTSVVYLTLEVIYKWASDKDVFEMAQEIVREKNLKLMQSRAWKLYLKGYVAHQKMSEKDSAKYLLDINNNVLKKGRFAGEYEPAKAAIAREILEEYDESILSSLKKDLEEEREQKQGRVNLSKTASEKEHDYYEFDSRIQALGYLLKKKAKQKAK